MRKFAFSFVACVASIFVAQSFAQPRDLFAEFEAEAEAAQSSEAVKTAPSSSSVVQAPAVSSSSTKASSSSTVKSSSSVAVSSSAVVPVSSSSIMSSSSIAAAISSSAEISSSSAEAPANEDPGSDSLTVAETDSLATDSTATDSAKAMTPEEAYAAEMKRLSEESRIRDSLAALSSSSVAAPSSSSMNRRELLGPVKVSKVNGIDEMKGRYKSPRKAMFMSLIVPGSGQMYIGGSKFTYIRGGVYLALEAALWGSWYYFSVYKYNKQVDRYKDYANRHYSIGVYEQGMRDLWNAGAHEFPAEFRNRYMNNRQSFCEAIFGNASINGCNDEAKYEKDDINYKNLFVNNPKSLGEEMGAVRFNSASEIYQIITEDAYVLGWDDADNESKAVVTSLDLETPGASPISLGTSNRQKEYRSMRNKANDYADMQAWFFGGLILNHLVSAIDAVRTANSHNKALYEEDLSWYDHLHFDSGVSLFDGFGVNVKAIWGF